MGENEDGGIDFKTTVSLKSHVIVENKSVKLTQKKRIIKSKILGIYENDANTIKTRALKTKKAEIKT